MSIQKNKNARQPEALLPPPSLVYEEEENDDEGAQMKHAIDAFMQVGKAISCSPTRNDSRRS